MVVQDLWSGDISRYWQDDLSAMTSPPFETGEDIALVTYFAPAEIQSILEPDVCKLAVQILLCAHDCVY